MGKGKRNKNKAKHATKQAQRALASVGLQNKISKPVRVHTDGNMLLLANKAGDLTGAMPADKLLEIGGTKFIRAEDIQKPGLDGTFRDTCIACLKPVDTSLSLDGEVEFVVAVLGEMGIPEATANAYIHTVNVEQYGAPNDEHGVPMHDIHFTMLVCTECATGAHPQMKPQLHLGNRSACIRQPISMRHGMPDDLLDLARDVRSEWAVADPKPIIVTEDKVPLGVWARTYLASAKDADVPVMLIRSLMYGSPSETTERQRQLHTVADIATGGSTGIPLDD